MRAWTTDGRTQTTKIRSAFMSVTRGFIALNIQAIVGEGDDRFVVAGRLFRKPEMIFDGESVLPFEFVRAFCELPVTRDVLDDDEVGILFLEILDFNLD